MSLLQGVRRLFRGEPADAEGIARTKRVEEDKLTVRVSQSGGVPQVFVPPTPDVLDPEREHHRE